MKNIFYLILITFLFFSCEKENEFIVTKNDIIGYWVVDSIYYIDDNTLVYNPNIMYELTTEFAYVTRNNIRYRFLGWWINNGVFLNIIDAHINFEENFEIIEFQNNNMKLYDYKSVNLSYYYLTRINN